jgi:hypothetical protein
VTPVPSRVRFAHAKKVTLGADQPEYAPLEAAVFEDGLTVTEWEPTAAELEILFKGGRVRLWTHTFNEPFQPVVIEAIE